MMSMDKNINRQTSNKSRHITKVEQAEVEQIQPREFERAKDVVGRKAEKQFAWALEFGQKDPAELDPGDLLNDRIRLRAFIWPSQAWAGPVELRFLPSASQVAEARGEFANMLQPLKANEHRGGEIRLMYEVTTSGDGRPMVSLGVWEPGGAATLRFARLLEEFGEALRRCNDPKCRRWFAGPRNKEYCGKTCLSRITTEQLRKRRGKK